VPDDSSTTYHLNDSYFRNNLFGIPCVVCHGVTAQGIVGPPNSFRFPGGAGSLEYYGNLRDTTASGVAAVGIGGTAYCGLAALIGPPTGSLLNYSVAELAGWYGMTVARVNAIANGFLTRCVALAYSAENASALLAYRLIALRVLEKYVTNPSIVGTATQRKPTVSCESSNNSLNGAYRFNEVQRRSEIGASAISWHSLPIVPSKSVDGSTHCDSTPIRSVPRTHLAETINLSN
jgi:hypothetical protein